MFRPLQQLPTDEEKFALLARFPLHVQWRSEQVDPSLGHRSGRPLARPSLWHTELMLPDAMPASCPDGEASMRRARTTCNVHARRWLRSCVHSSTTT